MLFLTGYYFFKYPPFSDPKYFLYRYARISELTMYGFDITTFLAYSFYITVLSWSLWRAIYLLGKKWMGWLNLGLFIIIYLLVFRRIELIYIYVLPWMNFTFTLLGLVILGAFLIWQLIRLGKQKKWAPLFILITHGVILLCMSIFMISSYQYVMTKDHTKAKSLLEKHEEWEQKEIDKCVELIIERLDDRIKKENIAAAQ